MTTTRDNIETVKGIYAAFGKGDVPAILVCLRENVQWEPGYERNSDIPWLASGSGHAHVVAFFGALQGLEFKRFEVLEVMGSGPWVVALTAVELVHKASGRVIAEACEPHVWRFDGEGKIASMRHAADTRLHARAAGVE